MQTKCLICDTSASSSKGPTSLGYDGTFYTCPECGRYFIASEREDLFTEKLRTREDARQNFITAIKQENKKNTNGYLFFDSVSIEKIAQGFFSEICSISIPEVK
jgi:hypothetical protein